MEPWVGGLHFPTSVAIAPDGAVYVAESGLPFGGGPRGGSVSRVDPAGRVHRLAAGLREPVNGILWHDGSLIVAEGGRRGRLSRLDLRGDAAAPPVVLVDDLPGFGNYQTNMVALGPDGKLYFSQGAMTNTGMIGPDSHELPWLGAVEHEPDRPGYAVTLGGHTAAVVDAAGRSVRTGGLAGFGAPHPPGTRLPARTPCTAGVMRCDLDGSGLEVVAWGLRNAYGLGFLPDGRLLATDQGADARGVRPVWNCPDFLYEVKAGAWYGWPDYYGGVAIGAARFRGPAGETQPFLLEDHGALPPPEPALLEFEVNACAVKFARVPAPRRHAGDLIVAQFGDERPITGPRGPRVGRDLIRVDTRAWSRHALPRLPLRRPIDVAFAPDAGVLYVVDFGDFEITPGKDLVARAGSGGIWKFPTAAVLEDP